MGNAALTDHDGAFVGLTLAERRIRERFCPATRQTFLDLLSSGYTIGRALSTLGLSWRDLAYVRRTFPTFEEQVWVSKRMAADWLVDELHSAHEGIKTATDVAKAKLKSDNIKWLAAKLNRERYGDRVDMTVTELVDVRGAMAEARARSGLVRRDEAEDAVVVAEDGLPDPFA